MRIMYILLIISTCCFISCQSTDQNPNPHAPSFNIESSDEEAIKIADEVMEAMGGRAAWDSTRFIGWNFFGRRTHMWDKMDHRVRIDIPNDTLSMIVDLKTKGGAAKKAGQMITDKEELKEILEKGYYTWINDSYWLVMPFKLKDDGVTLKSLGGGMTTLNKPAMLLELTFDGVGKTPQNKYIVYVDQVTKLVSQWDFYENASDIKERFQSPWPNYKKYGDLLLSGGKIAVNELTDIQVRQSVSEDTWTL